MMTFYEWLLSKTDRKDHLGKFARRMTGEKAQRLGVPKDGGSREWHDWIRMTLSKPNTYKTRRKAWRKFKMEWNRYQDETTKGGMARRYHNG